MSLYAASVPVFRHYLGRAGAIVAQGQDALQAQIGDGFPADQQFGIAAGFALRVAFPLAGKPVPEPAGSDAASRIAAALTALQPLQESDFVGAEARIITHRAGFADLRQTAADFLYLYGLPNFFFHLTMAYAALRGAGVALGKADFDGFHHYPAGFRFG